MYPKTRKFLYLKERLNSNYIRVKKLLFKSNYNFIALCIEKEAGRKILVYSGIS